MRTTLCRPWASAAVALASLWTPATALGQAQPGPVSKEPVDGRVAVDDVFERPVASGCAYQTRVRGVVVVRSRERALTAEAMRYDADLRVRSRVRCGAGDALEWERGVRVRGLDRAQLAARVAWRGTIVSRATGRACRYEPSFFFDGERFTGSWLRDGCGGAW